MYEPTNLSNNSCVLDTEIGLTPNSIIDGQIANSVLTSSSVDHVTIDVNEKELRVDNKKLSTNGLDAGDLSVKDMVKDVIDEEGVHGLNVRGIRNTNDCKKDVICVPGSVDYVYWIVEKGTTAWLKNQKQVFVQNIKFHTLMFIVQTNTSARHLLEFSKNIWSKEGFSSQESVLTFQSDVVNLDDYLHLNKKTPTYIVDDQTTVYNIRHSGLLWDCLGCTKGYTNCPN